VAFKFYSWFCKKSLLPLSKILPMNYRQGELRSPLLGKKCALKTHQRLCRRWLPFETANSFHQQSWCRKGSSETFNFYL